MALSQDTNLLLQILKETISNIRYLESRCDSIEKFNIDDVSVTNCLSDLVEKFEEELTNN